MVETSPAQLAHLEAELGLLCVYMYGFILSGAGGKLSQKFEFNKFVYRFNDIPAESQSRTEGLERQIGKQQKDLSVSSLYVPGRPGSPGGGAGGSHCSGSSVICWDVSTLQAETSCLSCTPLDIRIISQPSDGENPKYQTFSPLEK